MLKPKIFQNAPVRDAFADRGDAYHYHDRDSDMYVIGTGYPVSGPRCTEDKKVKPHYRRRYLRVRSSVGICTYAYITEPRKGETVSAIRGWREVRIVDRVFALALLGRELSELE